MRHRHWPYDSDTDNDEDERGEQQNIFIIMSFWCKWRMKWI